jgi:hypothetical protein
MHACIHTYLLLIDGAPCARSPLLLMLLLLLLLLLHSSMLHSSMHIST